MTKQSSNTVRDLAIGATIGYCASRAMATPPDGTLSTRARHPGGARRRSYPVVPWCWPADGSPVRSGATSQSLAR